MTKYKILTSILLVSLLGACGSTPYQPMAFKGGYLDTHIRDNLYFVEISTNAYTNSTTAVQYFHRRAKELCEENGYSDYRSVNERDTSTSYSVGSYGAGTMTASSMNKPGMAGYIECTK